MDSENRCHEEKHPISTQLGCSGFAGPGGSLRRVFPHAGCEKLWKISPESPNTSDSIFHTSIGDRCKTFGLCSLNSRSVKNTAITGDSHTYLLNQMNLTQRWTRCSNLAVFASVCSFWVPKKGKRNGDLGVSHISDWHIPKETLSEKRFKPSLGSLKLSGCLDTILLIFAFFYCKIWFEDHTGGLVSITCVSQFSFRLRNEKKSGGPRLFDRKMFGRRSICDPKSFFDCNLYARGGQQSFFWTTSTPQGVKDFVVLEVV